MVYDTQQRAPPSFSPSFFLLISTLFFRSTQLSASPYPCPLPSPVRTGGLTGPMRAARMHMFLCCTFTLYSRNLPFKISADEMYDIFGKYGAIRQVKTVFFYVLVCLCFYSCLAGLRANESPSF